MILSAKALSTFHIHGKITYRIENEIDFPYHNNILLTHQEWIWQRKFVIDKVQCYLQHTYVTKNYKNLESMYI